MIHPYRGIVLNNKKESMTYTFNNINEFQKYYIKLKKPSARTTCGRHHSWYSRKGKTEAQKTDQQLPGVGVNRVWVTLWNDGNISQLDHNGGNLTVFNFTELIQLYTLKR